MAAEELFDELASQLPDEPRRAGRFGFAAKGHSGRGDLAERHKEIRAQLIAEQRANDG